MSTKINITIAKRVSKNGNTYISGSIKCGEYAKRDYFFPNINAVEALTGYSVKQVEDAETGVIFDRDFEV